MGCGGSSRAATAPAAPSTPFPVTESAEPETGNFQIQLDKRWQNYGKTVDGILKQAFLVGHPYAKYTVGGHPYEWSFEKMTQRNMLSGTERKIRPPPTMRAPKEPLLPAGSIIVILVPPGAAGTTIEIRDPNNPGQKVKVVVPAGAKPGAQMAVPVPERGEGVEAVSRRQQSHSAGCKVAAGLAAAGAIAVGGVILGDHVTEGAVREWAAPELAAAGDSTADAAGDAAGWAGGAAADVAAWAPGAAGDAGDWAAGAAEHAGEWASGAVADVPDWAPDAAEDVEDWVGGAADDAHDCVLDLF